MEFSVWPGTNQPWADLVEVARHAELAGWDRVYVADHFMPNAALDDDETVSGPMLECWSVVAGLAAAVPRIGLGTLVCGNTCLLYTSPSPRDRTRSRMPSSA